MTSTRSATGNPLIAMPLDANGKPDVQAIYDLLMAQIEPDLVTAAMATLEQKYAGETPEQKAARDARYTAAFVRYDEMYAKFLAEAEQRMRTFEHLMLRASEHLTHYEEHGQLQSLESDITSA